MTLSIWMPSKFCGIATESGIGRREIRSFKPKYRNPGLDIG